ncbi:hypothetical protein PIB30_041738 [Stylosanthes scabra]|uniref:Uncharacterized protein n=1 Tax=Stylosanthes scabra TaxID=79078 RepID=A0ABU6ZDT3_9FABA|nr:hypothetical protein [Stylosanthes scabra]
MSGINVGTNVSELISSTAAAGSIGNPSHNVITSNAQSAAAVSTAIGSIRSTSEAKKKQLQDGNRTTVGGSSAQTPLGEGSHERGPRPRVEQPPPHHQTTAGWYPFGMPLNFQPSGVPSNPRGAVSNMVQFGSMSNEPVFNDINRNAASSSAIAPLSTTAVRQLIEESHLDLVNLLTSHLTTVLNPIVADSNAKYDQLAKWFDNLLGLGDDEGYNLNQA